MSNLKAGDIRYSGYPTSQVQGFYLNEDKELKFNKIKHLLWGDWVQITNFDDLDFVKLLRAGKYWELDENEKAVILATDLTAADQSYVNKKIQKMKDKGMIPVKVRGVTGYMNVADLQKNQLLEVVFLDVGQGDGALMITPDDKKYVIDAGIGDHAYRYLKWRFAGFKKSHTDFNGFIITHPDADHYRGFEDIIEDDRVCVDNIWHNGIVEQFKISGGEQDSKDTSFLLGKRTEQSGQDYLTGLIQTDEELAEHLSDKKRWVKNSSKRAKQYPQLLNRAQTVMHSEAPEEHSDDDHHAEGRRCPNIAMLSTMHGEMVDGKSYLPGFSPNNEDGCMIRVIGPVVEPDAQGKPRLRTFAEKPRKKTTSMDSGKTKNGHSILLRLEYKNLRLLFGGDLNSSAEMFLLQHYTGIDVFDDELENLNEVIEEAKPIFEVDVAKSCHHGSADFTDSFLKTVSAAATVISSGDEESHAHPRCDTIGATGMHGFGPRPLVFSTELARSAKEFTNMEDTPWYKAAKLKGELDMETDPVLRDALEARIAKYEEQTKVRNVTSYGAINLRSDGEKVVLAYMLEKPSKSRRWDVYCLEAPTGGRLRYKEVKKAAADEKKRREATS